MKILKTLAIVVGIIFFVAIIIKMLQKSVRTKIVFDGIDNVKETATVSVWSNDTQSNVYDIPFAMVGKMVYAANDFRLETAKLGHLIIFRVLNDQNQEMAIKPIDTRNAPVFTIYSE